MSVKWFIGLLLANSFHQGTPESTEIASGAKLTSDEAMSHSRVMRRSLAGVQGEIDTRSGMPQVQMAPDGSVQVPQRKRLEANTGGSELQLDYVTAHGAKDKNNITKQTSGTIGVVAAGSNHAFARTVMKSWVSILPKNGVYAVFGSFIGIFVIMSVVGAIISAVSGGSGTENEGAGEGEGENITRTLSQRQRAEQLATRSPEGLEEDIYGMGIAVIIRDSQRIALKTPIAALRWSRLSVSVLVLLFTMTLQIFLMYEVRHLVTAVSTSEARQVYDQYETAMYGANGTKKIDNGYTRGIDESHFKKGNFETLDDDLKDSACQMPLSQPVFFIGILLIWTLLCAAEMRSALGLGAALIWQTPTIDSMANATRETPEEGDEAVLVEGLTATVKALLAICIIIPRLVVSCVLLWLGCRWLCGTMGFSDVLQNAVTLGFILLLKNIFYKTMAPHHNKLETRNTMILPHSNKADPGALMFLGAFGWGILSIIWVIMYVEYVQQVLPEYNWDIHEACIDYLDSVESATA
jgi:hypothetical protein